MKKEKMLKGVAIFVLFTVSSVSYVSGAIIESVTVYERTGYVQPFTFTTNDTRLGKDPQFGQGSFDFTFFAGGTEVYDVYASNNNGTPNMQGMYLTIGCILPGAGINGCNIDAVSVDYNDGTHQWATIVTAYTLGGGQTYEGANPNAALGSPDDIPTYMGNEFSSLTVGFGLSQPIISIPFDSVWMSRVSFPLNLTYANNIEGNTTILSSKDLFTGIIRVYTKERNLASNENGCYMFITNDSGNISMCFNQIAFISQAWLSDNKKPEKFVIKAAGELTFPTGGLNTGPLLLDAKGSWKTDSENPFFKVKGKISGGKDTFFVIEGNNNASLSKQ